MGMDTLQDKLDQPDSPSPPRKKKPYVQQLEELSDDPQYAIGQPQDNRSTLQEAISKAEAAYQKKSDVNEWAEVGQMLGKAAAQYAAAQAGMKSERNLGNIDPGQSIDYGARTDRAFRQYQQAVNNSKDLNAADKQQFQEGEQAKKESFNRKQEPLKLGAQAEREASQQASSERNTNARITEQNQKEDRTRQQHQTDMNVKDIQGDEKDLEKAAQNGQTLIANEEVLDDLSSKDASKLQSKYGAAAGAAGIDMAQVKANAEDPNKYPETDKSILGFSYKGKDPDRYKKSLRAEVQKIQDRLAEVRAQKKQLLGGGQRPSAPGTAPTAPQNSGAGASNKTVTQAQINAYATQYKMAPDAARKYLENQGYTFQP